MAETGSDGKRKGLLLAGGLNTRLYPSTLATPKALLPVYDKPLLYYPLSLLMLVGVREIALIVAAGWEHVFRRLLGDGQALGLRLRILSQTSPRGIADALIVAEKYLDGRPSVLVLGDNILYGENLAKPLGRAEKRSSGATIFAQRVDDPRRFGVVELNEDGKIISLEEKPEKPKSSFAGAGLYFYDHRAPEFASRLSPSLRGELEINDLNKIYLELGCLSVEMLDSGTKWFDAGTTDSLLDTAGKVRDEQQRKGRMIACPEEIAWRKGWIGDNELSHAVRRHKNGTYAKYLDRLLGS